MYARFLRAALEWPRPRYRAADLLGFLPPPSYSFILPGLDKADARLVVMITGATQRDGSARSCSYLVPLEPSTPTIARDGILHVSTLCPPESVPSDLVSSF